MPSQGTLVHTALACAAAVMIRGSRWCMAASTGSVRGAIKVLVLPHAGADLMLCLHPLQADA
jgi:hypothetical protein